MKKKFDIDSETAAEIAGQVIYTQYELINEIVCNLEEDKLAPNEYQDFLKLAELTASLRISAKYFGYGEDE
jgi:hypothetical protein